MNALLSEIRKIKEENILLKTELKKSFQDVNLRLQTTENSLPQVFQSIKTSETAVLQALKTNEMSVLQIKGAFETFQSEIEKQSKTIKNISYRLSDIEEKKNNYPKVSLIIPVYNTEKYLRKCLDSVINQTFKSIEIICIDDGSTDESLSILNEYAKKDERFIVLTQKNQKLGAARNAGLDRACGKYIMFLDADDWLELDAVESLYKAMENSKSDIALGNCKVVTENEKLFARAASFQKYYDEHKKPEGQHNFDGNFTAYRSAAWCKLYRKNIIDTYNMKFPEKLIQEDEAWHWYYFSVIDNVYSVDKILYNRLIHERSIMSQRDYYNVGILDHIYILKYILDYLHINKLYVKYKKQYINYCENVKKTILGKTIKDEKLHIEAKNELKKLEELIENYK
jgi:glycosyltransferase involved in cell wall biosynthesis